MSQVRRHWHTNAPRWGGDRQRWGATWGDISTRLQAMVPFIYTVPGELSFSLWVLTSATPFASNFIRLVSCTGVYERHSLSVCLKSSAINITYPPSVFARLKRLRVVSVDIQPHLDPTMAFSKRALGGLASIVLLGLSNAQTSTDCNPLDTNSEFPRQYLSQVRQGGSSANKQLITLCSLPGRPRAWHDHQHRLHARRIRLLHRQRPDLW